MIPKAILFDVDGTLVPFDGIIKHIQKTFEHFNLKSPSEKVLLENIIGYKITESIPKLVPETKDIIMDFLNYYSESYKNDVENIKPFSYTKPVLDEIRKMGIKIGVVTTKSNIRAKTTMDHYGVPYDVVIGFDDVENVKPNPEPILKACEILGIDPKECFFVGDHPFDMQAAKAAGCYAVGTLDGWGNEEILKETGADIVIKDLISLKKLLQ